MTRSIQLRPGFQKGLGEEDGGCGRRRTDDGKGGVEGGWRMEDACREEEKREKAKEGRRKREEGREGRKTEIPEFFFCGPKIL